MSEIKPVYQKQAKNGDWEDVSFKEYSNSKSATRILYPAAAYEALQKENAAQTKRIEEAVSRIKDMLENDDGQAHKEARKFIESLSTSKNRDNK